MMKTLPLLCRASAEWDLVGWTPEGALGCLIVYPFWRICYPLGFRVLLKRQYFTQGREMAMKETV